MINQRRQNKLLVLFLLFFLLPSTRVVAQQSKVLEGLALAQVKTKKMEFEFEQVVRVSDSVISFVAIDDFGGEVFRVSFGDKGMFLNMADKLLYAPKKKFKKIMSLPITQEEFSKILRYEKSDLFSSHKEGNDEVWTKDKKKRLVVRFSDFANKKHIGRFPLKVSIQYKKNFFNLTWLKIK